MEEEKQDIYKSKSPYYFSVLFCPLIRETLIPPSRWLCHKSAPISFVFKLRGKPHTYFPATVRKP